MANPILTLIQGHTLEVLKGMPCESVHCVVTSPPYWGLRDYKIEPVLWGGQEGCEHEWIQGLPAPTKNAMQGSTETIKHPPIVGTGKGQAGQFCLKCNARLGSLGLEPTPELYVEHLVEIFREVKRVLRKDGTLWLNMADSYAGSGSPGGDFRDGKGGNEYLRPYNRKGHNLKPKDLCGIPWRVAFALQADGWWLRSDIIWAKPNPMPESVRDRPTRSHEYIFLLTKAASYYYDQEAVRENWADNRMGRAGGRIENRLKLDSSRHDRTNQSLLEAPKTSGRNKRTVWTITTQPFPGAHFATFPEDLVKPCILAGTSGKGCCPKCGAPWVRMLEKKPSEFNIRVRDAKAGRATPEEGYKATEEEISRYPGNHPEQGWQKTIGWRPSCKCGLKEMVPCLVLDPFVGSGTTCKVAIELGRSAIGIDINPDYLEMARKRCVQTGMVMG